MSSAFDFVVLAASAGGIEALTTILADLPGDFDVPIAVVLHRMQEGTDLRPQLLQRRTALAVKHPNDGEFPEPRTVYLAPANRHLLVAPGPRLILSGATPVHSTRPSADPLFESAGRVFGARLVAGVLSGGGLDGTPGVRAVKRAGGVVFAQDKATSVLFGMPRSAIATGLVDFVLPIESVAPALQSLVKTGCWPPKEPSP